MTSMIGDVVNRVRRLPKPTKASEALQPLFEAVSNAMHAVEDRFQSEALAMGSIAVTVTGLKDAPAFEAVVTDNGIGLDDKRYIAFCTADTDFKLARGGKGIGRLLWLDAFDKVDVVSIYLQDGQLWRRSFRFQLDPIDQITGEDVQALGTGDHLLGTTVTFRGLRGNHYPAKLPSNSATLIRHFGSHFLADFIMQNAPAIELAVEEKTASFPGDIRDLLIAERGTVPIETKEFGELKLASFVCKKEASTDFDGTHQLHFVANGRTVSTRKIDGLLGLGKFGPKEEHVYHGCVTGPFLDERVNQERTHFNFDETVAEEIAKYCAQSVRTQALQAEIKSFDAQRLTTMSDFLKEYPSFGFDAPEALLDRTPKNAIKAEQFAQALIPTRIRRDNARRESVQRIVSTLSSEQGIPSDFAEAVRKAAQEVHAEEQRQLTEYVLRRKMVLDVMEVLVRRIRERAGKEDDYHLESTLHNFICPMKVRGDDPTKIEDTEHDLWVIDERLAFARYFASDVPLTALLADTKSTERPDLLIFDKLHGLGMEGEEPLRNVMLVEFKRPGRPNYDERYTPLSQVSRYLKELVEGRVETFDRDRVRIAPDCVFNCFIIADLVGNLEVDTDSWRTTSNGRGRWIELGGKYKGSIEIIEWKDLVKDARARNSAFISAVGS